jgi:hypothetical protein
MQAPQAVTKELLSENCMIAVTVLFGKAFLGDTTVTNRLLHHPLCKDEFVPPVKVSLEKTDCPQLMHKHIPQDLFKEDS